MKYSIKLLYANGQDSYLSVKGRIEWKTKCIARAHAKDIASLKTRSGLMKDLVEVCLENEFLETLESWRIEP